LVPQHHVSVARALAISAVTAVSLYVLFDWAFQVTLPRGYLGAALVGCGRIAMSCGPPPPRPACGERPTRRSRAGEGPGERTRQPLTLASLGSVSLAPDKGGSALSPQAGRGGRSA
ncbi:MAG: hypothetical protein ACJ8EC_00375, partial [Microvirga sp.]